jgi:trehalose synthase
MYNALQPGVFALSGWDLTGMLTLPAEEVAELIGEGDTRWIHRAAHDLMGVAPDATRSAEGMPRGRSLYGSVPDQLADEASFLRQLAAILAVRKHYGIATSRQVDVPDVSARGLLVLVHELESSGPPRHALTVLNFAGEPVTATVRSEVLVPGSSVTDMFTQEPVGVVDDLHAFTVDHNAHQGHALLVEAPRD